MKRFEKMLPVIICLVLCAFFTACTPQTTGKETEAPSAFSLSPDAVIEIVETERSQIETTASSAEILTEAPEVIVTGALPPAQTKKPQKEDVAPEKTYYTVKFVDSDGYTALSVQSVEAGHDAVPPTMPEKKDGLLFQGWNKDYTNVSKNMIVIAIYAEKTYKVSFFDINGKVLKEARVPYGGSASAPPLPQRSCAVFDGWTEMADDVTADVNTYAMYTLASGRSALSLQEAYADELVVIGTSIGGIDAGRYFHDGELTVGEKTYTDILCGNFEDRILMSNYGFTRLTGSLVFGGGENTAITLTIECDGKPAFTKTLETAGITPFSVRLADVGLVRIKLETYRDGVLYDAAVSDCVGGIVNGKFEN